MNKFIIISVVFLFCSCKSFYNVTEEQIQNDAKNEYTKLNPIDLNNYDLFCRIIVRTKPEDNFYCSKDPRKISKVDKKSKAEPILIDEEKLELQYLFLEKEKDSKEKRKVIYISTIPPYKSGNEFNYNQTLFDDIHCINVNFFNFFKLGYFDKTKSTLFFYKDCCYKDYWHIDLNDNFLNITALEFDYKTKFSEVPNVKFNLSNNVSDIDINKFYKINKYQLIINNNLVSNCSSLCTTRNNNQNLIYYDEINKRMYFRFEDYYDDNNIYKWLFFDGSRTLNYWIE